MAGNRFKMRIAGAGIFLVIAGGVFSALLPGSPAAVAGVSEAVVTEDGSEDGLGAGDPVPVLESLLPGEQIVRALREAYPTRIDSIEIRDGEWTLSMDGVVYYWANGRLLPEADRDRWEEFVPVFFYSYSLDPLEQTKPTPEQEERLREYNDEGNVDTRRRFNEFLDALYGINTLAAAERTMVQTRLLGMAARVHPLLVKPIRSINRSVGELAKADPEIRAWIDTLHQVHGYNWRNIANTPRRSYHTYGAAVDLVPYTYQRRSVYWLWAAESGIDEWWKIRIEDRWLVPEPIVAIFEENGFVWGGKWMMFDNIHFEYRPEVILLARDGVEVPSTDEEF